MHIDFPDEVIEKIADKVVEKLLPHLHLQPEDEIMTVDEAAALLKTSKTRIYNKVFDESHNMGDGFPFHKDGRRLIFYRSEILSWLGKA